MKREPFCGMETQGDIELAYLVYAINLEIIQS